MRLIQELFSLHSSQDLVQILINEHNYQHIDEDCILENGAFLIHPKEWNEGDKSSASKCWKVMKVHGYQFIGLPEPKQIDGKSSKFYDGLINSKPTEIKAIEPFCSNVWNAIRRKITESKNQKAEIALICFDESYSFDECELTQFAKRTHGVLNTHPIESTLKSVHILTMNDKRIISR